MAETRDVIIIGAGHNGLITAYYLAKAGLKPLVLERRPQVGGCAITNEFHPGFRCSTLAHATGPIRADIIRDMNLAAHGLKTYVPDVRVLSLSPDAQNLALYSDAGRTQQEIAKYSTKEAASYAEFQKAMANIAAVVDRLLAMTPPDIDAPASGNVFELLNTGRKIRGLDEKDFYRLFRWMPMAAADLVAEWFDTELLRATIAAQGIFGTCLGPWSAGSGATLLMRAAADGNPAGGATYVMGGTGALTTAMAIAAQAASVEIRTNVEVSQVKIKDGVAVGVVLSNGVEIETRAVISN